jgi:hypothetical protein
MLNRLRCQLSMGMHVNREFQKEWNEFGLEAFVFEVLDVLTAAERPGSDPTDDLRALEEIWLDKLSPFGDQGYNAGPERAG